MIKAIVTNEMIQKDPPPPEIPPQSSMFSDPATSKLGYYDKQIKWFMRQAIPESYKERLYQDMLTKATELYNNIRGGKPPPPPPPAAPKPPNPLPKPPKKHQKLPKDYPTPYTTPMVEKDRKRQSSPVNETPPTPMVKKNSKRQSSPVYSGFRFSALPDLFEEEEDNGKNRKRQSSPVNETPPTPMVKKNRKQRSSSVNETPTTPMVKKNRRPRSLSVYSGFKKRQITPVYSGFRF